MKILLGVLTVISASLSNAEEYPFPEPKVYEGNFLYFDDIPKTLFLFGPIESNSELWFRRAVRYHNVDKLVLMSPGGDVDAGLNIAGIVHDQGISTYIPESINFDPKVADALPASQACMSACSFIYLGGINRFADGALGVHQFSSNYEDPEIRKRRVPLDEAREHFEIQSQATVAEIIAILNGFDVPPSVYEYMFNQPEMYFLSKSQLREVSNDVPKDWHSEANARTFEFFKALETIALDRQSSQQEVVAAPTPNPVNVKIKRLQFVLNNHNCDAGIEDGVMGPRTLNAMRKFYSTISIPPPKLSKSNIDKVIETIESRTPPVCQKAAVTQPSSVPNLQDKDKGVSSLPRPFGPAVFDERTSLVGYWSLNADCIKSSDSYMLEASIMNPRKTYKSFLGQTKSSWLIEYDIFLGARTKITNGRIYESDSRKLQLTHLEQSSHADRIQMSGSLSPNRRQFKLYDGGCEITATMR